MQRAIEDEVSEFLGRERYQRAEGDGGAIYRNGYERRTVKTTSGPIELKRPPIRNASELREPGARPRRRAHALEALIILGFRRSG